jgi:hypothetical protein
MESGMVCRTNEKYGKACKAGICANDLEVDIRSRSQLGRTISNHHYLGLLTLVLLIASCKYVEPSLAVSIGIFSTFEGWMNHLMWT